MPAAYFLASGWRAIISLGGVHTGPFGLAPDIGVAAPQEAGAADVGAVAGGVAVAFDAVDVMVVRIDDDRARRLLGLVAHGGPKIFRVHPADVGGRDREALARHRRVELGRRGVAGVLGPRRNPASARARQARRGADRDGPPAATRRCRFVVSPDLGAALRTHGHSANSGYVGTDHDGRLRHHVGSAVVSTQSPNGCGPEHTGVGAAGGALLRRRVPCRARRPHDGRRIWRTRAGGSTSPSASTRGCSTPPA